MRSGLLPPPATRVASPAPFGHFPASAAISLTGLSDVRIESLTFTGPEFRQINLFQCHNVTINYCDFNGCGGGIYLLECTGILDIGFVRGYEMKGVPGNDNAHLIQLDDSHMEGRIHNFKNLNGITGDVVSLYKSGGVDATHRLYVEDFQMEGGNWTNASGCGVIVGDGGNAGYATVRRFTILNAAANGISIAGGADYEIYDGVIYGAQRVDSQCGFIVWDFSGAGGCGGHIVQGNKCEWFKSDGTHNNRFDAGQCGTITGWDADNLWGAPAGIDPSTLRVTL